MALYCLLSNEYTPPSQDTHAADSGPCVHMILLVPAAKPVRHRTSQVVGGCEGIFSVGAGPLEVVSKSCFLAQVWPAQVSNQVALTKPCFLQIPILIQLNADKYKTKYFKVTF